MKNLKLSVLLVVLGMVGCASVPTPDPVIELSKKQMGADANIQLGMAYLQKPDVRLAKQKFLNALQLTPEYPPVWYAMAYYLEATGDNKRANEYYLRAIQLAPKNGETQNNLQSLLPLDQLSPRVLWLAARTAKKIHQPEEEKIFLRRLHTSVSS